MKARGVVGANRKLAPKNAGPHYGEGTSVCAMPLFVAMRATNSAPDLGPGTSTILTLPEDA